jgi:hypothetical protein
MSWTLKIQAMRVKKKRGQKTAQTAAQRRSQRG